MRELFLALCISVTLLYACVTYAEKPCIEPPTAQEMIDELNADEFIHDRMGFSFEQDGAVLLFHTGKSFEEINNDWMRYGNLTQMISNNWKVITGYGVVVGLDNEDMIAFACDNNCAFRMAETPKKLEREPVKKPKKKLKRGIFINSV